MSAMITRHAPSPGGLFEGLAGCGRRINVNMTPAAGGGSAVRLVDRLTKAFFS